MVNSGECVLEVHRAAVHQYVNGGIFGERALINDEPRTASTKITSKTLVCFRMKQKVFKVTTERIKILHQVKLLWSFDRQEFTEAAQVFHKGDRVVTSTSWSVGGGH